MFVLQSTLVGYLTALSGFLAGGLIFFMSSRYNDRLHGALVGFSGGLLLAFACFELLPHAFFSGNFYMVILGMLLGVFLTAIVEERLLQTAYHVKLTGFQNKNIVLWFCLLWGITLHNIPEGLAVGSLYCKSYFQGLRLCLIMSLHCLPEGLALAASMKERNVPARNILLSLILLSIPMAVGSLFGSVLYQRVPEAISFCFALAGGVMLYVTCGEVLPESRQIWRGRFTTLGALCGFTLGTMMIYQL